MLPAVLKIRDFRNLWLGQTVSQLGDAIYGLLFLFMVDKITQRPELVGLVAALTALPFLFVSPFAGVLADRMDRRRILLFCDFASAILLGGFALVLVFSPTPPLWSLFVTPFLLSVVNAFFLPARGAAIPTLVPSDQLIAANSLSSATLNLMHTVGLMIAALLLAPLESINPSQFFLIAVLTNLGTFLASAIFVLRLPSLEPRKSDSEMAHPLTDLKEGVKLFAANPVLKLMFASSLVVNLAVSGFMVVYTATNREWFDGKFVTLALVEMSFLVALVAGSVIVPKFKINRIGWVYAIGLTLVGLDIIALGWARTVPLYVIGNIVAGFALPFVNIPFMTYLNLAVPSEYRGRINSFQTMISAGVQPLGSAFSGTGLRLFGLVGMYIGMGGAMTLAAVAPLANRKFRNATLPEPTQS